MLFFLFLIDLKDLLKAIIVTMYWVFMAYELITWITAMSQGIGGRIEQTLLGSSCNPHEAVKVIWRQI